MIIEEHIQPENLHVLVGAATHYAGNGKYVLRTLDHNDVTKDFVMDGIAFDHLSKMIDHSILEGLADLEDHGEQA
ncbi:hypothetical protein [Mycobacterium arosiense]|uniref:Uncharacterized protein n=1 Tax=Mycobacterium arosiense ATCC BAA-1401 = DSM 45069 TaxID=1265311 RepID=A0A1W9ZQC7_MYCAI|nr:hypothetical protein [Mycobacterium arosiense]ORA20042.1 hypothetical protein BST14_02625 [Mycobacterium arosiense ATCC BAA-1401 = DSM 45069]